MQRRFWGGPGWKRAVVYLCPDALFLLGALVDFFRFDFSFSGVYSSSEASSGAGAMLSMSSFSSSLLGSPQLPGRFVPPFVGFLFEIFTAGAR